MHMRADAHARMHLHMRYACMRSKAQPALYTHTDVYALSLYEMLYMHGEHMHADRAFKTQPALYMHMLTMYVEPKYAHI